MKQNCKLRYIQYTSLVFASSFLLLGCSSKRQLNTQPRVSKIAHRQLAPEGTYGRLRWVHLPQVTPADRIVREPQYDGRKQILPIVEYKVNGVTLEEAADILAGATRYRAYCSSSIAKKLLTLHMLGTVDEIAEEISAKSGILVQVDHQNTSVRFLAGTGESMDESSRQQSSAHMHRAPRQAPPAPHFSAGAIEDDSSVAPLYRAPNNTVESSAPLYKSDEDGSVRGPVQGSHTGVVIEEAPANEGMLQQTSFSGQEKVSPQQSGKMVTQEG